MLPRGGWHSTLAGCISRAVCVRGRQGSLVRAVRRVEEVLRQAVAGAQVMGETALVDLLQEGQRRIKRDIIFAASLYL